MSPGVWGSSMRDLQWLFPLRGKWLGWLLVPVLAFVLLLFAGEALFHAL